MKIGYLTVFGYDARHWPIVASGGILFLLLGAWIIFSPERDYLFLSKVLAIGLCASGFFEVVFSLFLARAHKDWGWIFAGGLIDALLGMYLLNYPLLSLILMPMIIGLWMLLRGFMTVSSPVILKVWGIRDWIWLVSTSIVLILPSLLILIYPIIGLANVALLTGISFGLSGLFRISFARQLSKLKI